MNRSSKRKYLVGALAFAGFVALAFIARESSRASREDAQKKYEKEHKKVEREEDYLRMIDDANDELEGRTEIKVKPVHSYVKRAYAKAQLEEFDEMQADLRKAKEADPVLYLKSGNIFEIPYLWARKGQYERAIALFEQFVADPNATAANRASYGRFLVMTVREDLRDLPRGISYLKEYADGDMEDWHYRTDLAIAYALSNDFAQALTVGRKASELAIAFAESKVQAYEKRVAQFREKLPQSVAGEEKNLEAARSSLQKTKDRYEKLLNGFEQRIVQRPNYGY
jgi:tetratricopeptide (TPR) repeat protein